MASLIMANMNTLIRKGYLLAGVIIAANMFIVNEVRASNMPQKETENDPKKDQKKYEQETLDIDIEGKINPSATQAGPIATLLGKKVFINFLGTFAVSCLNNYFNLWDYKSGKYLDWKFGFFGWRTKRFLNDYLQLEVNLNVYRGLGWGILHIVNLLKTKPEKGNEMSLDNIKMEEIEETKKENTNENKTLNKNGIGFEKAPKTDNFNFKNFIFSCAPGFISAPLTIHISKFDFSISISIDSILWIGIGKILDRTKEVKDGKDSNNLTDIDDNIASKPVRIVTKIDN